MKCKICGRNSCRWGSPEGTFQVLLKRRARVDSRFWTKNVAAFSNFADTLMLYSGFPSCLVNTSTKFRNPCLKNIELTSDITRRDAVAPTCMLVQCKENQQTDQTQSHLAENTYPQVFWEMQDFCARVEAEKDNCYSLPYRCTTSHFRLDVGFCLWYLYYRKSWRYVSTCVIINTLQSFLIGLPLHYRWTAFSTI